MIHPNLIFIPTPIPIFPIIHILEIAEGENHSIPIIIILPFILILIFPILILIPTTILAFTLIIHTIILILEITDQPTEGENHSCSRFPQRCVQDVAAHLIIVITE